MIVNLQATPYTAEKKGDVKRMRKDGKLPAVLYGHKEKTQTIYIEKNEFKKVLDALRKEAVTVNLSIKDKEYLCVIKAIQHNPITDELLHIDFQHIHKSEKIKALIPIHIIGEAPGVKQGGILDQHLHEVVVKCLPADMPSHIDVDVSNLELGQTIHLSDVELPRVEYELSSETPIVSILVPRAVAAEAKPAAEKEEVAEEKKEGEEVKEEAKEAEKTEESEQKKEKKE
ncbi:MAG TPA: 50S ribosomal protein L25 [candidate division WOR-3 bacterium]|uniref:Large ribosomal subunit protein bL25 n=1 Tax=candidate division WOR-3 bacterium TaxID=2052148 RepID=A0A9C9EMV2_UNCW3|nr:50S ribosomal protein L25 [candidate division WOR-3 bacterium]